MSLVIVGTLTYWRCTGRSNSVCWWFLTPYSYLNDLPKLIQCLRNYFHQYQPITAFWLVFSTFLYKKFCLYIGHSVINIGNSWCADVVSQTLLIFHIFHSMSILLLQMYILFRPAACGPLRPVLWRMRQQHPSVTSDPDGPTRARTGSYRQPEIGAGFLSMVEHQWEKRLICDVISHWLRPCSAIDRKQALMMVSFRSNITPVYRQWSYIDGLV